MAKLMLVEDDNNLREIYQARLQAEGYNIVSASDGEQALVVAKAEKPDLIIADVMMPKISGFEMLDILRNTEELKGVKVIMLTALGQSDDQQRATQLGADRYLVKSQVTLEDIVKTAHDLLGDSGGAVAATVAPDASASAPVPEPTPTEPVAETAQPSTQEEADVEAKIEDFVAGATDAAAPMSIPVAEPVADDSATAAAVDDQLVADAADALAASTEADTDAGSAPEVVVPSDPEPEAAPEPKELSSTDSANDNVTISGKKIIEPIDSAPKKDLDVLLAEEESKNQQGNLAAAPPVIVTNEAGTQAADEEPASTPSIGTVSPTTDATNPVNTVSGPVPAPGSSSTAQGTPGSSFDPNQVAL